jgi:STE24 endopeptidase
MNEDKAARYQRLRRYVALAALIWSVSLLLALTWTGGAVGLRRFVETLPGSDTTTGLVIWYVAALVMLHEVGAAVVGFYGGFELERQYGVSTQTAPQWLADEVKGAVISFVLGVVAAGTVLWTIRVWPDWWWLLASVLFAAGLALLANLAPTVLLPLFYTVRPLTREALRSRLIALADRAGANVLGAYEWGLGDKSGKANAALTGLGSTRRILVSDTMLADYSDDEIEVVLAHELAHHVHGDIWQGLAFDCVVLAIGFFLASRVLVWSVPRLGLAGPADVAGLPLVVLAVGAVFVLTMPLLYARSRAAERRADRFALALTRNPTAFVSAMRRLGQQNLAEDRPSRLVQWLFYSHPPLRERVAAASEAGRTWLAREAG